MQINEEKLELFERTPVPKALFTMALPTIISQLITLIYNVGDTFFIGRAGNPLMMAGTSVCFPLVMIMTAFCNLFGVGTGTAISRLNGQGEYERARKICSFGFYCAIALSLIYTGTMLIFLDRFLYLLGASDATIGYARSYAQVVLIAGALPGIMAPVLAHLLRNVGYSRQSSLGLSGGGILNIILDPLFMFVIFPKGQEVFAAALATLISNVLSCLYLLITLIRTSKSATLSIDPGYIKNVRKEDVKTLFKAGVPSALLVGLYDVGNMVLYSQMGMHGDLAIAAIGIVVKVERIPNSIGIGIAQGMMPLISYNYGARNSDRMISFIKHARKFGLFVMLGCVVLYQCVASPLCSIFMSTTAGDAATAVETLALASVFLRIRSLCSPFMFMNYHSSYCMQAIGYTKGAIIHVFIRIFAFHIPLMILMNHLLGANGLCAALPVGDLFGGIIAFIFLNRQLKKCRESWKEIPQEQEAAV